MSLSDASSDLVVAAARLLRAVRRAYPQPPGIRVLSLLDEHGSLGITGLAEADHCSQPTMSGTVSALVERGWASKEPHPDDARSAVVALTPTGRRTLEGYRRDIGDLLGDRLAAQGQVSAADLTVAMSVLSKSLDAFSNPRGVPRADQPRLATSKGRS